MFSNNFPGHAHKKCTTVIFPYKAYGHWIPETDMYSAPGGHPGDVFPWLGSTQEYINLVTSAWHEYTTNTLQHDVLPIRHNGKNEEVSTISDSNHDRGMPLPHPPPFSLSPPLVELHSHDDSDRANDLNSPCTRNGLTQARGKNTDGTARPEQ